MKVALVHEWLTVIGGSENVFKEIALLYPDADIFTLVARDKTIKKLGFDNRTVKTSFIQNLPFGKTRYRSYLPFFPLAIEQFDLSSYDLIISSSHAVAKGALTNSNQLHICYCHSPMRYAWDLYHQYLKESGLNTGFKGFMAKLVLHKIRQWDVISNQRVDYFISNSNYIGKRIKKIYGRSSVTIYPCVDVQNFEQAKVTGDYYFTCSRFVPYKKIDLIVQAFNSMPDRKLIIIGDGPDFKKIKQTAKSNINLMGYQSFDILKQYMAQAKAFVFAAEEDFGIVPIEAQACGVPVIAFGKGGLLETIIDKETGIFFYEQTMEAIRDAIIRFEENSNCVSKNEIQKHARKFDTSRFKREFKEYVDLILSQSNLNNN